jgi:hypothetical protein
MKNDSSIPAGGSDGAGDYRQVTNSATMPKSVLPAYLAIVQVMLVEAEMQAYIRDFEIGFRPVGPDHFTFMLSGEFDVSSEAGLRAYHEVLELPGSEFG